MKLEKNKRCNYCRKLGHTIEECKKRIENEKKKKQQGLAATTDDNKEETNIAHDDFALSVTCCDSHDHTAHVVDAWSITCNDMLTPNSCLSVSSVQWYFDSGASLSDAPLGGYVMCANNASYDIKSIDFM